MTWVGEWARAASVVAHRAAAWSFRYCHFIVRRFDNLAEHAGENVYMQPGSRVKPRQPIDLDRVDVWSGSRGSGKDRGSIGDEPIDHVSGWKITPGDHEAAGLMCDNRVDLGRAVTDPLVLHQDRPALPGCLLDPVDVGYLLVGRNSISARPG